MTPPLAIVDTNVVISGLLTSNPESPVARILDGMLTAAFPFALSPALLAEYRAVLMRPTIGRLHGLTADEIDRFLSEIVANAVWREPTQSAHAPDPGDDHLWELLGACKGGVLITGDRLLLDNPPDFASVLSPRSFLELLDT